MAAAPECGKDCALTPSYTIWSHSIPGDMLSLLEHTTAQTSGYENCNGSAQEPMTTEQCQRWDEWLQEKRAEERAAWEKRQQEEARQQLAETRWAFRRFDEHSFKACPWRSDRVALIAIADDGAVTYACQPEPKCELLRSDYRVLAAWPGEWSQDIFLLSDQYKTAALAVLTSGPA